MGKVVETAGGAVACGAAACPCTAGGAIISTSAAWCSTATMGGAWPEEPAAAAAGGKMPEEWDEEAEYLRGKAGTGTSKPEPEWPPRPMPKHWQNQQASI